MLFNYALYTPSGQYIKIFFWGSIRLGEDPTFWQIVATWLTDTYGWLKWKVQFLDLCQIHFQDQYPLSKLARLELCNAIRPLKLNKHTWIVYYGNWQWNFNYSTTSHIGIKANRLNKLPIYWYTTTPSPPSLHVESKIGYMIRVWISNKSVLCELLSCQFLKCCQFTIKTFCVYTFENLYVHDMLVNITYLDHLINKDVHIFKHLRSELK